MQCFLCGVGMLSHPYKYSIGFPSELNLGSARRSRTSQETSERSGARQVRRKGGVSNTVIMTRVINFKLTHSAVQTAASGHYLPLPVTFELVASCGAERPVFGEQFEGGNFSNRPEAACSSYI